MMVNSTLGDLGKMVNLVLGLKIEKILPLSLIIIAYYQFMQVIPIQYLLTVTKMFMLLALTVTIDS